MAILAYIILLLGWVVFVPAVLRAPAGARRWAVAATLLGLAATLYEGWMTFVWGPSVAGPIRLDILLVFLLLVVVYLTAAARLWGDGWVRTALAASGGTAVALVLMTTAWARTGAEASRLRDAFEAGDRMLFEAKFRDRSAYESYFGDTGDPVAELPAGHWAAESGSHYTRLIVSDSGHAYLYHRCGATECQFGPGSRLTPRSGGPGWEAELTKRGVGRRRLVVGPVIADTLSVLIDGRGVRFVRSEPPLLEIDDPERLEYLGAYSAAERVRQHARVSQLWLWRADDQLLAVGIFRYLLPGRPADFVTPAVLGRGLRDDGGWRFRWEQGGRPWEAIVRLQDGEVAIELPGRADLWPPHTLSRPGLFRDEVVELAPLTDRAAWDRWFETLLVAHFSSAEIPPM